MSQTLESHIGEQPETERRYFYCCSLPLEVGSVIRPGNWGRILRTYTSQAGQGLWTLSRELIWEIVRLRSFPEKPGRLGAIFACLSQKDLAEFQTTTGRRRDLAFEVELIDPTAPAHLGDWTLLNFQSADDVSALEKRATQYWQSTNVVKCELVTSSAIRILRMLS
jgi:hypothetical protein